MTVAVGGGSEAALAESGTALEVSIGVGAIGAAITSGASLRLTRKVSVDEGEIAAGGADSQRGNGATGALSIEKAAR